MLGAGTPSLTHNGYPVTDANGNLTDLNGNPLINTFANKPGFPGFSPTATQSLAYLADMQESGIPVTYGYISDLHERKAGTSGCTTGLGDRQRQADRARVTAATSPTPRTTTRRSTRSSSGWPPTASPRRTPSS